MNKQDLQAKLFGQHQPPTDSIELLGYYDSDDEQLVVRHPDRLCEVMTAEQYISLEDAR